MFRNGKYILAVDQSTQGTKGLIFDKQGKLIARADRPHRQIIDANGYVEHDPMEIMENTCAVSREVIEKAGIDPEELKAMGISNQRETTVAWNKRTGKPVMNAIVWQCARAAKVAEKHADEAEMIRQKTGITLSPYFPAAKIQWILENVPEARRLQDCGDLAVGTIDSWLIYNLSRRAVFTTDYSNASRTQLFNIHTLEWDEEILRSFGISRESLPEVAMSDSLFAQTDLDDLLMDCIPICGVLGDSHGALFGQNCRRKGELKATYGTGSSVMMNIGDQPILSDKGIVTSLAWGKNHKVEYVFEGNLNYTGAVISWLKDDVGLIQNAAETAALAEQANPEDRTIFVPAFTGLGSPYWDSNATGMFTGITRTTGRKELVKAGLECIAYQITDLIGLMRQEAQLDINSIRVDGGPTANRYLMQFQSDLANCSVRIPELQELSGMGAAYMAGIASGLYDENQIYDGISYTEYQPGMEKEEREKKLERWGEAVRQVLTHS